MSAEENAAVFRRVVEEGFGRGDTAVIDEVVSPRFVEHEAGPLQEQGREGLKMLVAMMHEAFPDLRVTVEDLTADGDKVWARLRFQGTNTGPFMGQPPTGRSIDIGAHDLCRCEGGQLTEHWGVMDQLSMLQQLGLVPLGPATAGAAPAD